MNVRIWVSHYCWCDDDTLVAFDEDQAGHRRFRVFGLSSGTVDTADHAELLVDGHPSAARGGRWVVVDTYPDGFMMQRLSLWDREAMEVWPVLQLRVPFRFRHEDRCDFHPRWNRQGNRICFDSAHLAERSLCVVDVTSIVDPDRSTSESAGS